ncbi:RNA-binding protein 33-like isoform X2 [Mizuhopecten yessoensis]|uniref:RNA-binding protein 33-like isoform X2 n=1 Tax=Mizuhopecten yessoensis TaxID=6573 RepID=UPI000B45ACC7|nr:RNA-binding protein 33-like isoform X2 [Mizuhopecten yessoensis]
MRFGFVLLLQVLPLLVQSRFSNFEAVPAPQHEPIKLMDAISEDGSVVYSDDTSRMTSVKDNNFKACFITDFDPEWNLDINEKQEVVNTHEPEIVRSPLQYEHLKVRTGDMIAMMCKKSKIYWLTETHSQPLQSYSSRAAVSGEAAMPPPVYHPLVPVHRAPHAQLQAPQHMPRPAHVAHVQQHAPAHIGVPQHVPAHMGVPQHASAHMGVPQHAPAHMGVPQHAPAQMQSQRDPSPQMVPAHVQAHAAFTAPGRAPVLAPHHAPEHIPAHAAFHAPAHVVVPAHKPQVMLVPRHLPFIRPPMSVAAQVPGKRHSSQQSHDRPMAVPQKLSMARPHVQPHH